MSEDPKTAVDAATAEFELTAAERDWHRANLGGAPNREMQLLQERFEKAEAAARAAGVISR